MKLIIQIPCYNEEQTLPETIADLPKSVPGFDRVEVLVIDDGSEDRTAELARKSGAHHVVALGGHQGLARAFMAGLHEAVKLGADVIVNTDADNQYAAGDIAKLTEPVRRGEADMVVGCRPIEEIREFSPFKKCLQRIGSWAVCWAASQKIPDVTSGFRAYSREAALRLDVRSSYTYTHETIIQASRKLLRVVPISIRVNPGIRRPSRLVTGVWSYVKRSMAIITRIYLMYEPLKVFSLASLPFLAVGGVVIARFLYYYSIGQGTGKIQSLILAAALVLVGFQILLLALLADLIAANRRILEDIQYQVRKNKLDH